jgi:hypothetical protein
MSVEIVIDELVLRGIAPERAHAVAAALEARLHQLAAGGGELAPREEASRRLAPITLHESDGLGEAVAERVWNGIGGRT